MIERVFLDNVLAFQRLDIETRGLTVLSGTNSAGKSSFLHALALLRQSRIAGTLPDALLLNGDIVELGTGRDVLHSDPAPLSGVEDVALRIGIRAQSGSRDFVALYDAEANVLEVPRKTGISSLGGLFERGFQYLRADRIVPAVTYPKSHEAAVAQRFLGADGRHAPNFLRVHRDERIACAPAEHPESVSIRLLDQTNAWLADLSPGTSVEVADIEGTDLVRLVFRRSGPEVRTEAHRATNVGFGLTYALPVIVACVTASPNTLLLVENPEAHLHPRGQMLLGRLCALAAAGGAQVIVETHSDHVLNAIRLAVKRKELAAETVILHFFARQDGVLQPHLESIPVGADGMIPHWPSGFFDQWDKALDELLD